MLQVLFKDIVLRHYTTDRSAKTHIGRRVWFLVVFGLPFNYSYCYVYCCLETPVWLTKMYEAFLTNTARESTHGAIFRYQRFKNSNYLCVPVCHLREQCGCLLQAGCIYSHSFGRNSVFIVTDITPTLMAHFDAAVVNAVRSCIKTKSIAPPRASYVPRASECVLGQPTIAA